MDKVCPICKKTFSSSTCLPLHMLIHTGEKPHKCDLCGKAFRQKNHVQSHKMYNHRSEQQTVVGDDKRNLFKRYPKYKSAVLSRKKNLNPTVVGDDKRNPFKIYTKYKSAVLSRKKNLNPTVVGDDKRDPGSKIYPKYNSAVLSRKKNVYSFLCRQCPRRFLTDDQRLRHECLHERPSSERSVCELCSGVYHTGRGIERHREGWCRGRTTSPRKPVQPREENRTNSPRKPVQPREENRTTSPRKPVQPREEKLATEECPKCGQKFATAQNLQRHLSTIHQKRGGEAFQCSVCDGSFLSSRVLSMHLISGNCLRKDESPGEECPKCGQKFATAHNLQRHLSTIHQKRVGKAFRCPGCDGRFLSSGVLSRHLNSGNCQREDSSVASGSSTNEPTSSRSRYPCSCCGSSFGSEMALQQHLKCQHCRVQFVRPKSFHKHFQHCGAKAKSKHSCFKCRKTFKFSSLLSKHQAQTSCGSIEDRFHCSVCEKHFSTKEMLRRHELWSHELERLAQRPGSSTKTQPTKLHKGEDVDEEPDQSHSGVKSARNIFEAAFKIKRESEVAGARLYECAVCTAKFKFSQGIKRHNAMHEDPADKPFVCSACRGRFRTHMGFTKHRRNCQLIDRNTPIKIPSHSDMDEDDEFSDIPPINNPDASAAVIDESEESSVASSVGDNSSTTSRNGEMNEIEVDDVPDHEGSRNESGGVMKSRLVCRHCDVEFVYSKSYQAHVNLCETRSEGRQFPCTRCPRTFNSRTALNRHRKDHKENYASKARPKFACPKCRKTFRYLSLFVRHQKTCRSAHHRFRFPWQRNGKANEGASEPRKDENVGQAIFHLSGNKVKSDRNVFEMMKRSPDKDKGPFVCTFCSAEYPSRLSLANHRRIHERSDDRTIVCSACGGRFLSLSALKRHQYYCKTIRRKLPRTNRNSEIGSEDELSDGSDEPAIEDADLSDDSVEQAVEDDELADVDSMFTGVTSDAEIGNEDKQESGVARVGEHSSRTPMYDEWNADKFACSVCNATFETEKAHKRHLKCRNCGIKFVSAKMYHEHFQGCQAKAEPPMPCPGCQKPFKSSMHLSCHLDTCEWSDGSFSCSVCRGKFSNKCELRFHKRTHGKVVHREMSFSCPGCLETFTNSCKFDSHVESCEGIDGIPCCSDCGELLTTSKLLRDHQLRDKDHGKTFVPPLGISEIGGKDFGVDASKISSHVPVANAGETSTKRSMVSYECGVCLNQFKNRRLRDQHAEVHRNVASKPYSCTSCRGGFWNVDALAKHKRFCGMNKLGTVAPLSETRPVKGAGFLNRRKSAPLPNSSTTNRAGSSAADGDSRTLTAVVRPFGPRRGKRPWPCDVCSKSFDSARGRSIHRSRHNKPSVGHDNVPGFTKVTAETAKTAAERKLPFYIELIDPPSVSSDDTVVELESALYSTSAEPSSVVATSDDDNNNVPRSCIKCQYTTNIWSELQAHIGRCFESYDNSQYRLCLPCCKLFPKETITTHKRECESSPYQCRVCYIRFPALHELRSHIRAEHRVLSGDERFEKPDYSPTSDGKERTEPPLDQRFLLELVDVTPLEESDVAMTDDEESRDRDMFTPVIESTQTMDPAQWDSAPAQTQLTNGSPSSRNSSPQKVVRFEVNAFKALLSNIAANETLETESSAQLMTSDEFVSEETVCSVCSIVFENAEKLADHIGKDHVCLD